MWAELMPLNRYSEILDYHNVEAGITQMDDQFNGQ